jgi:phosphoserine phosphatase
MNVYDFDNTIYDGESGVQLFFFYLKKYPSLVRYAPRVLKGVYDYRRHRVTLDEALVNYADVFHEFLSRVDLERDVREFWDQHANRLRTFIRTLRRPDDLVISASPEQSLREACTRLGIQRWIGTKINEQTASFDFICYRENKVRAFRQQYPGQEIDYFYTDSLNDKPLMDIARHVVMVGKKGAMARVK